MSALHIVRCLAVAALLAPTALLAQQTPLQSGTPVTFNLPGESAVSGIYIDVPADAGALRIELDSLTANRDVDFVVRHGSAFNVGSPVDDDALRDQAHYRSISATGEEFVTITPAGTQPLAAGRWHIVAFNYDIAPAETRVLATVLDEAPIVPIQVVYDDTRPDDDGEACNTSPWSDSQRRAAMDRAAELLTQELRPVAPIRVQACWTATEEGTLAFASAQTLFLHDLGEGQSMPWLPDRYSLFSSAATVQRAGTDRCRVGGGSCDELRFDIRATFGTDADFFYGLSGSTPGGQSNFISTAMHEITHGLGFYGLLNVETGARVRWADPYLANVRWAIPGIGATPILEMTDEQRQAAVTSNNLRFHGENALLANGGSIKLYSPGNVNPGSTLSHLDTFQFGTELMAHRIPAAAPQTLGMALPILYDVGWDPAPKAAPQFTLPDSGQYYDPARNGHGIAMYRVAGTTDIYFVVFYTYDNAGNPEYYVSSGRVIDGVFVPSRNESGDSLLRSLYDPSQNPPTVLDSSAAFTGLVRIDFNAAADSPACQDGTPGRSFDGTSAVMTFTLPGNAAEQWCLQSIIENPDVDADLTNIWFNESDVGWGASALSFAGDGDGLAMQIYYPDAQGRPRWALMATGTYEDGGTYPLYQIDGYCRDCPAPAEQTRVEIGSVTVSLQDSGAPGALTFSVTYPGSQGGTFTRDTTVVPGGAPND